MLPILLMHVQWHSWRAPHPSRLSLIYSAWLWLCMVNNEFVGHLTNVIHCHVINSFRLQWPSHINSNFASMMKNLDLWFTVDSSITLSFNHESAECRCHASNYGLFQVRMAILRFYYHVELGAYFGVGSTLFESDIICTTASLWILSCCSSTIHKNFLPPDPTANV